MIAFIKKHWMLLSFLTVLVCLSYANGLNNAFVSDDLRVIPQNPHLTDLGFIFSNPLSSPRLLFYMLAFKIGGLNPIFYRLINIFFHTCTVWVIYMLLTYFTRIHKNLIKKPVPILTASIFAIHPIMVESVTWISGGSYSQNGFFLLTTFFLYVISKEHQQFYFIALVSYLFLLGSAPYAIVFPIILFLYEFSFGTIKKTSKKILPFFGLLTILVGSYFLQINQRISALATEYSQAKGLDNIFIKIPAAITTYLQLIFWPENLSFYHSQFIFSPIEYLLRLLFFCLFIMLIFFSFRENRLIFFWLSFFVISLLPTLTPLRIAWIVAERYVYIGSLGIFIAVILLLQKYFEQKKTRTFAFSVFGIIVVLLLGRTILRNIDWKNEDNLWFATAKTDPLNPLNHNNLGDVYIRHGNLEKAAEEFGIAIKLDPNYFNAYHNLALTYGKMGKKEEALANYHQAIKINPRLWQSYQEIALIHYQDKQYEKAYQYMEKAISVSPDNVNLYINLGIMYFQNQRKSEAKKMFERALEIDPKNKKAIKGRQLLDNETDRGG